MEASRPFIPFLFFLLQFVLFLSQENRLWVSFWRFVMKPLLKRSYEKKLKTIGWEGLFREARAHWQGMNHFSDLEDY